MVVGAVGTGKTSACMYPYVDQLLRWQKSGSGTQDRRPGDGSEGRLLSTSSDECSPMPGAPTTTSKSVSTTGTCYNPLHNDLDPYAVAYAIASLLNNLFGKSKEPFWQQAYTDLLKFVILLRRLTDGYTTLSDVYRYILDDSQIDRDIRRLKTALSEPPEVMVVSMVEFHLLGLHRSWTHWFQEDDEPHGASVRCRARDLPGRQGRVVSSPKSAGQRLGGPASINSMLSSAGSLAAGAGSIRDCDPPSPRASSCSFRCSTTTPRCTAPSVHRVECLCGHAVSGRANVPTADRHPARCRQGARAQLSGRDESRTGTDHGRHAEAGFSACCAASGSLE